MDNENRQVAGRTGLNAFLGKLYGFMAGAVAISAIVAFLIDTVFAKQVLPYLAQNNWVVWVLFIVQLALVFTTSMRADRSPALTAMGLFVFAAIEGLFFSTLLLVYTSQDIASAFGSAAVVFVVLSVFGLNTKKDLSKFGRQAYAALIALIIVSLINLFLRSPMINFVFSIIGVVIFTVLTAWDTQRMKQLYFNAGGQINTTNLALVGAFQLYLDFVNLFLQFLQIFGIGSQKD